jgi:predicted DsbA family dithiol-disulfide isomerase
MDIHIWSDIACPFCYIGKRHLEKALLEFEGAVNIHWHSFQLDPTITADQAGVPISQYLAESKGMSESQMAQMMEGVTKMGEEAGLQMKLSSAILANTYPAHLLLQFAQSKGKGNEAKELLMKSYFVENDNVSAVQVLQNILNDIGEETTNINEVLQDEAWDKKFQDDLYTAQQFGIRGVPFFVFNGKYSISGAQPVDVLLRVLKQSV